MALTPKGYVVDPSTINHDRTAVQAFVPVTPGQRYVVLTKAGVGASPVEQTGDFEAFENTNEALAVASAFNNGLDSVDLNSWGIVVKTVPA